MPRVTAGEFIRNVLTALGAGLALNVFVGNVLLPKPVIATPIIAEQGRGLGGRYTHSVYLRDDAGDCVEIFTYSLSNTWAAQASMVHVEAAKCQ